MPMMPITPSAYATDEDITLMASADFQILCPKDQILAYGTDGAFTDPWTLTSSSVDFAANGLASGHIIRLSQPTSLYKPPGDAFAVVSVTPTSVLLRRKGQLPGTGQPAGLTVPSGVEFAVSTLGPQIARASYDLNRNFGIDDLITGRRSSDLFDPLEVREATVLMVLARQYLDMSRGSQDHADSFAMKSQLYRRELDDVLGKAIVHWKVSSGQTEMTKFGTRLCR